MRAISVGRGSSNDIVLTERTVSERHAEILWDGKGLLIRDLGSTNGTYVNGVRITGVTPVALSDRVTLGTSVELDLQEVYARLQGAGTPNRITIGRAPDNSLVLSDPHVSAHHAVLEQRGTAWVLRDLGSKNGTYVNGERITEEVRLADGDVVRFGKSGPVYRFPEMFGVESAGGAGGDVSQRGVGSGESSARASAILPVFSSRIHLWRSPYVWAGFVALVVMCLLFSYTGNPFAYNAYIYLFGFFSCATVLWFVYRLCGKRYPWWYVVLPAVFTAIMTVPVLVILHAVFGIPTPTGESSVFLRRFLEHTFIVGATEEFVKILPLLLVMIYGAHRRAQSGQLGIQEPLDGIMMAASSAIGFVVLETIFLYCNPERVRTDYQAWAALQLLIPRIFAAIGGHVAYSAYFGYFLGLAAQQRARYFLYGMIGYACAAVCHGLWNSVAVYGVWAMIGASSVAYFLFMAAIMRARAVSESVLRQTVYVLRPQQ